MHALHLVINLTYHSDDIVPTLSLGTLKDLKNAAATFFDEPGLAEEVVGRVFGLCTQIYGLRCRY